MTTLLGNELYAYIDKLSSELNRLKSQVEKDSFIYLGHSQMDMILNAEKNFLKTVYSSNPDVQPMLSIALTGLPSIESLSADLEKICEMHLESNKDIEAKSEKSDSQLIASQYMKANKFDCVDWSQYVPTSKSAWSRQFATESRKGALDNKIFFFIKDNDESIRLSMMQGFYVHGFDKYSQEFPLMIRSQNIKYKVAWNTLLTESSETYHTLKTYNAPNNLPVKISAPVSLQKSRKYREDMEIRYQFKRRDFEGLGYFENMFLGRKGDELNYKAFVDSGYNSRLKKANAILDVLDRLYDGHIKLQKEKRNVPDKDFLDREDLFDAMKFSDKILYNNPEQVPFNSSKGDVYTLIDFGSSNFSDRSIGTISFVEPHLGTTDTFFDDDVTRFIKGGIKLKLSHSCIKTDEQYLSLKKELSKL